MHHQAVLHHHCPLHRRRKSRGMELWCRTCPATGYFQNSLVRSRRASIISQDEPTLFWEVPCIRRELGLVPTVCHGPASLNMCSFSIFFCASSTFGVDHDGRTQGVGVAARGAANRIAQTCLKVPQASSKPRCLKSKLNPKTRTVNAVCFQRLPAR